MIEVESGSQWSWTTPFRHVLLHQKHLLSFFLD